MMNQLIAKIESYGFECEAGPLSNCVDWQQLQATIEQQAAKIATMRELAIEFESFLNKPPQYENLRTVREYRYDAFAKFQTIVKAITTPNQKES